MTIWVVCNGGGFLFQYGRKEKYKTNFDKDSIGELRKEKEKVGSQFHAAASFLNNILNKGRGR